MTVGCDRCGVQFRDNYNLNKHKLRKIQCEQKIPLTPTEKTCEYCLKTFSTKQSKTRHYDSCKSQDDPVRRLEMELGVTIKVSEKECRFNCCKMNQ